MVKRIVFSLAAALGLAACQSEVIAPERPLTVAGQYNAIGECLVRSMVAKGYESPWVNYKDFTASKSAQVTYSVTAAWIVSSTRRMVNIDLKQIDAGHTEVHIDAINTLGRDFGKEALEMLAGCKSG